MLSGVAKSGSPISRWTMRLPSASSRRALASTSKAPSVPNRVMRSAKRITELILVDAEQRSAVHAQRLTGDVAGLPRAEECAGRAELFRITKALHRRGLPLARYLFFWVKPSGAGDVTRAVGQDGIRREAVDG